jgi:hypothetical protein
MVLLLAAGIAPGLAADSPAGPGRLAVCGAYPTGYIGTLARYGLPRDILHDMELKDPAVLCSYNTLIMAGAPDNPVDFEPALQAFLERGGELIFDYSTGNLTIRGVQAAERGAWARRNRPGEPTLFSGMFTSLGKGLKDPEAVPGSPLATDLKVIEDPDETSAPKPARGMMGANRVGFIPNPTGLSDPAVLAVYPEATLNPPEKPAGARGEKPAEDEVPADKPMPAIIMGRVGNGRVILCGPAIGMSSSLMGADYDNLILGLLRTISNGRLTPELTPEGPHLGRKQSLKSMGATESAAADAIDAPPAPEREDGPGPRGAAPAGYVSLAGDQPDEFTVSGLVPKADADLLLHCWNADNFVRVVVGPAGLAIRRRVFGKDKPDDVSACAQALTPGTPFTVKVRCDHLFVESADAMADCDTKYFCKGGLYASTGFDPRPKCRTVESVYFSDDFMRTTENAGGWVTRGGKWYTVSVENPDMGANPFSYKVDSPDGVAVALQGTAQWDEYRYICAVRPGSTSGTVGLGWYAKDADNMYLFEAALTPDGSPVPGGLRLVKLVNGQKQFLAVLPGSLAAFQWYQIDVKTHGVWVSVAIDGVDTRLKAKDATYRSGKIALRVDHASSRFDNVLVQTEIIPRPVGKRIVSKVPQYAGIIDIDSWAGPATPWDPDALFRGLFWRRYQLYGDQYIRYDVPSLPDGSTTLLAIESSPNATTSGTALDLRRKGDTGFVTLRRNNQSLAQATVTLSDKTSLELERTSDLLTGRVDDQPVVRAVAADLEGGQMALWTIGYKPRITGLSLWSRNLADYTFDTAPVDWWVGGGAWDLTNRWSCTPDWSWFGGVNLDGVAAIWNKKPTAGDVLMDFYTGPKMLSKTKDGQDFMGDRAANGANKPSDEPPEINIGGGRTAILPKERFGDFNCVLCGDGRNVGSGYSFVTCPLEVPQPEARPVGARNGPPPPPPPTQVHASSGRGAFIYRNGVLVQRADFVYFQHGHNRWVDITVAKHGSVVSLAVDGQVVVSYVDPKPLDGGYAGIWTRNNGIMVPRVTISSQRVPEGPVLSLLPMLAARP